MNRLDEHMVDEISKDMAFRLIDLHSFPVLEVMDSLLEDKTTGKNIIWATDAYVSYGLGCSDKDHIFKQVFTNDKPVILLPRIEKALKQQQERTRSKAEVFTPVWLCNLMNNYCDEQWFGRKDVFNCENDDHTWTVTEGKIEFPEGKTWQDYVDSKRLEITCGEAPYLISRYDVSTGEFIESTLRRIGILDRKLRIVNENTKSKEEWVKWTGRAYQSCYGYEYQGDSLLIARINLLITFQDYYIERWGCVPSLDEVIHIANIIAWNTWQMDGLKDTVPFGKPYQEQRQMTLFDSFGSIERKPQESVALPCKIFNWRTNNLLLFKKCKRDKMGKKMFDFVIGNPPYQESQEATSDTPVYNQFMDLAFDIGDCVELITPARFLFNAGKTPKEWNKKVLNDPHLKVIEYTQSSSNIFPGTDIKGGVVVTYRDAKKTLGPIGFFTSYLQLNSILKKVQPYLSSKTLDDEIYPQNKWNLSTLYKDYPEYKEKIGSAGRERRLTTSIFALDVFRDVKQEGDVEILGLIGNKRVRKYVKSIYIDFENSNIEYYKVILPKSNGSGAIGEVLSTPLVGYPLVGYTQSFMSFGSFNNIVEANACMKYIKSKFARTLLGVLKVTQDNNKGTWIDVPIQNFSDSSDIDWSKSVQYIDQQLYAKYNLSSDEIEFIESHIQEMN